VHKGRNIALAMLLFCATTFAGELIVRAFKVPTYIFPAPSQVAIALWRGFGSGVWRSRGRCAGRGRLRGRGRRRG